MPAQVCHLLFAEDALQAALGPAAEKLLAEHGNIYRFGAQGPDFFYHNQRTKPTGLKYGVNAHREGYGRLMANMIRELRHLQAKRNDDLPRVKAYILGFATHAFLDKSTHPFIDYHSGWVEADNKDSERYFRCHVFFERILDVLILKRRRGLNIREYGVLPLLDCGPMLPYTVIKTLVKSLNATYPNTHFKSRDRQRVENAYVDCMGFYTFTDPLNPHYRRLAYERDRSSFGDRRRLALFHPLELPQDVDFLNLKRAAWTHPCRRQWRYNQSFPELFEAALEQTLPVLARLAEVLEGQGLPEEIERLIGNESLGTGLGFKERCTLQYNDPLPLPELLDGMYGELDRISDRSPAAGLPA